MKFSWTKDQEKVIELRDRNILVSAAAGSGKTAVLVARILSMITDSRHPIDIDQLLIVTFTNAAAGEMKERILNAIEKALAKDPGNSHLQKQITLVHHAQITTIHSFCQHVIRNYFHTIDLDPSFRIGDEGEMKLLRMDVVETILEKAYEKGEEDFLHFVECYAAGKSDSALSDMILGLYDFSMSHPWPVSWLLQCQKAYEIEGEGEFGVWIQAVLENIRLLLEEAKETMQRALKICRHADGPYMYEDAILADLELLDDLAMGEDYPEYAEKFLQKKALKKLSSKKDEKVSEPKRELVKALRDQMKKTLTSIEEQYFFETPKQMAADMKEAGRAMGVLIALTCDFYESFSAKKREKNLLDFHDLEHMALHILVKEEDGAAVPTEAAKQLAEGFAEIMIDEYQDSNLVQEYILTSVSRKYQNRQNLFMVGDVKQSIYRFRLARPELFMEKYTTYTTEDSPYQKIELHQNFRSRKEVLVGVNDIFRCIMRQELGNISYDDAAALYPGAFFPEEKEKTERNTEILLLHTDGYPDAAEETKETDKELEARMIGKRILELVGKEQVVDKGTGTYRPAQYRDIVILLRTISGWADPMAEILNNMGIPCYTGSQTGYFSAVEIQTVLSLLKVIDNPEQDIPLAAVLHSGIAGVTDEELAKIRNLRPKHSFFQAVTAYLTEGEEKELGKKLETFLSILADFRKRVSYTPIHELLWYILDTTGYGDYAAAMPGGEQRTANLNMLVEKAIAYESTSYRGLFNFIRYMEQLKKYEVDFGEASILGEEEDTVRILSIHKSKGLEYPIVFVAGMAKPFNRQDSRSKLVFHPEMGIGCDCIDPKNRTKVPTLLKKAVQRQIFNENLGEELRVLYVAMTRAKERLIMTASVSGLEKKLEKWSGCCQEPGMPLFFGTLSGAGSYLDWIMPVLLTYPTGIRLLERFGIDFTKTDRKETWQYEILLRTIGDLAQEEAFRQLENKYAKESLLHWNKEGIRHQKLHDHLEKTFSYQYSWADSQEIYGKITVSELKKLGQMTDREEEWMMYEEPEIVPLIPEFKKEETKIRGAAKGTIYHKALELLDFRKEARKEILEEQLSRMYQSGKMTEQEMQVIETEQLLSFLQSDLGRRMKKADSRNALFREQPFVLGMKAKEIRTEWTGDDLVLVQGIIDAYFEEDGQLVLADYKTDYAGFGKEAELAEKYEVQLSCYAKALERLTGKKVKEKIIYSFSLQKEITIL